MSTCESDDPAITAKSAGNLVGASGYAKIVFTGTRKLKVENIHSSQTVPG